MTQVTTPATPPAATTDAAPPTAEPKRPSRVDRSVGVVRVLRDAVRAIGPDRKRPVLLCVLSVVAGVLESVMLYLVARLALGTGTGAGEVTIDVGPIQTEPLSISTIGAITGVVLVAWIVVGFPMARTSASLSRRTLVRLRRNLVSAYLSAPWSEISKDREGRFQQLASDYCYRCERLVQLGSMIVVFGLNIIVILIVAIIIAPLGALIALVVLGGLGAALRPIAKRVRSGTLAFATSNRQFNSQIAQTARVAQEITAFNVGPQVGEWLEPDVQAAGYAIERMRFSTTYMPMLYQFGALAFVIVLAGAISVGDSTSAVVLAPVLLLLIRVLGYGRQLQNAIQSGVELTPYIDGLLEEMARLEEARVPPGTAAVASPTPLVFTDVAYAYQPDHDVLRDVTLTVETGDVVGVVGPSGGGKSTFSQLLLNLRWPTRGSVTAAGVSLRSVEAECWSRLVALVPQDNKLVLGTVADNVRFFRPWFSDDDVERAVRAAHLHDEVLALPEGYDTIVGPGARELSGGQRQRLGVARALVGRPQMLILDEPTSALDARSERLIVDTLAELAATTTLIVVAHRPATLEVCRRLLVVDGGRIVESDPRTYHGSIE